MSDQPTKAASELVVGDRIAGNFLPGMRAAEVLFIHRYHGPRNLPWVYVTAKAMFSSPDGHYFEPDARIPVEPVAHRGPTQADLDAAKFAGGWAAATAQAIEDDTDDGLGYSREMDDSSPVSPARVPLHTGSVVNGDELVIDQSVVCSCATDPLECIPDGPSARAALAAADRLRPS